MRNTRSKLGLIVLVAMMTGAVSAAVIKWNVASGDWAVDTNWTENRIPHAGEWIYINNGGTATVSSAQVGGNLSVAQDSNGTGGAVTVSSGGTITLNNLYAGNGPNAGTGVININGGTITTTDHTFLSHATNSIGVLNITNGGSLINAKDAFLGYNGTGIATVTGSGSIWKVRSCMVGVNATSDASLTIEDYGLVSVGSGLSIAGGGSDGVIRMKEGGMLALNDAGTTATDITAFLALVSGDNIDYWNGTAWADITDGTLGTDYTLTEYDDGAISFTKLTVPVPPPKGTMILVR